MLYVGEGVFDFADSKREVIVIFKLLVSTRGITKYLTFGAGMKTGAVIGVAIGGLPVHL